MHCWLFIFEDNHVLFEGRFCVKLGILSAGPLKYLLVFGKCYKALKPVEPHYRDLKL